MISSFVIDETARLPVLYPSYFEDGNLYTWKNGLDIKVDHGLFT